MLDFQLTLVTRGGRNQNGQPTEGDVKDKIIQRLVKSPVAKKRSKFR
jgi:hypothetical protein